MVDVASWTHQAAPTMPTLISGVFPVGTSSEFRVVNPANKASSPTGRTPRAAPARQGCLTNQFRRYSLRQGM
jgi:hypothetical protein